MQEHHVLIHTDVTAKDHVNRQGRTRSKTLMQEALHIGRWAEAHLSSLHADHITGKENLQADFLSRTMVKPSEWQLHPDLFQDICHRFGQPQVDLFASPANAQLPRFFTRYPSPGAENMDALRCPWPPGLLYTFPPLALLPRVIRKIIAEAAEVIPIAPHWPWRPWFSDLVALSMARPWRIPPERVSLSQGAIYHPEPQWLHLTAWPLRGSS